MSNVKKLLTVDDLVKFCAKNKFYSFSAKNSGYQLSVQVPSEFEAVDDVKDDTLLFCKVKLFHIGENRNRSSVTEEAATKALPTIAYKPLLANFCEIDGEKDFTAHDMIVDDDGNVEYLERQIGCFTSDVPEIKYDEETDKMFVYARVAIPREYTAACDIIERKNGTKISVELLVNEMEYSVKENVLKLTDIIVSGATCLGKNPETREPVEEGMKGARLDIEDFSQKQNSVFSSIDTTKLIETLDKLNLTLERFQDKNVKKGVEIMNMFDQLLEKYGVTAEDVDFEVEGLSDEDLQSAFEEHFKCKKKCEEDETEDEPGTGDEETDPPASDPEPTGDDDDDDDDAEQTSDDDNDHISAKKNKYSVDTEGNAHIEYELSHDDIRCAIYSLLYAEDNYDVWVVEVFDTYFIGQNYMDGKFFKQHYTKTEDSVAFEDESVEVFAEYLTQTEKDVLAALKADYAELKAFKDTYEAAETKAKKDEIFANEAYNEIRDSEDFKGLMADAEKFSVDDIQTKCDLMFAAKMKKTFTKEPEKQHKIQFNLNTTQDKKKKTYGNLFDK